MMSAKKIGVLIESDFYENEIFYYQHRFQEDGVELQFLSRLWGKDSLSFSGHEFRAPLTCTESFEGLSDEALRSFAAIIVPSGMVADRLRYTEDPTKVPPATTFLARAFKEDGIIKGIICHGLWLCAPMPELIRGRKLTCHNNLVGDARAYGAQYVDQDLVVDGTLVTARTGAHCHLLAKAILGRIRA